MVTITLNEHTSNVLGLDPELPLGERKAALLAAVLVESMVGGSAPMDWTPDGKRLTVYIPLERLKREKLAPYAITLTQGGTDEAGHTLCLVVTNHCTHPQLERPTDHDPYVCTACGAQPLVNWMPKPQPRP